MHQYINIIQVFRQLKFEQVYKSSLYNCANLTGEKWRSNYIDQGGEMQKKANRRLSYDEQVEKCSDFLSNFEDHSFMELADGYDKYDSNYVISQQQVANGASDGIEILYEDLENFFRREDEKQLVENFKHNTQHYNSIFTRLVGKMMPERSIAVDPQHAIQHKLENVLNEQRKQNIKDSQYFNEREEIPNSLKYRFDVQIVYGGNAKKTVHSISTLTSNEIGALISCKAIVVRNSQIKPMLVVATYACEVCGCENYKQIFNQTYSPLTKCTSSKCKQNNVNGKLAFLPTHSKFQAFQKLKIQQTPDQLEQGAIPKTFELHLRGSIVNTASPGDKIEVQGILMTKRRDGFMHQNDLAFNTYIQGCKITREKKKYVEMTISKQQIDQVEHIRASMSDEVLFKKLAYSIAPEIYGMEAVKKALLLLLAGGVTKQTHDMLRIRGEINIALVGDPGIAKSQLLKHISYLAPRGIYTTGKGSSGVGLTAALVTDPVTRELSLEAGALVLADMGVCCIDEFDKMDEYDRTAIHQVMQQQTVSIAKAGITTTLNARTSILAAANPLYGRYNPRESAQKNINMPAALLSRFDMVFILLDNANKEKDFQLAQHIGMIHQMKNLKLKKDTFSSQFIRTFIAMAKQYNPTINETLHKELIVKYLNKRKEECGLSKEGETYTTLRTLLALVRLSQARAKLRFSNEVELTDVLDCLELLEESQKHLMDKDLIKKPKQDSISAIFKIIKEMCSYDSRTQLDLIEKRIMARGYSKQELDIAITNYKLLNVLMVENNEVMVIQ